MNKQFLILISLVFLSFNTIFSQNNFEPGYIIKNNGDTVKGEIIFAGYNTLQKNCTFKNVETDSIQTFSPKQIKEYAFSSGKVFVSREYKKKWNFYEVLITGHLSLMLLSENYVEQFYLERKDIKLKKLEYFTEIRENSMGKDYLYESKNHMGVLSLLMNDSPVDLSGKIKAIKTPSKIPLIALVKTYNEEVIGKEGYKVLYNKKSNVNFSIAPIIGLSMMKSNDATLSSGILCFISSPHNKQFNLRTGIISNSNPFDMIVKSKRIVSANEMEYTSSIETYKLTNIHLVGQYSFPLKYIQPYLGVGYCFLFAKPAFTKIPFYATAGFNFSMYKKLKGIVDYGITYNPDVFNKGDNSFSMHSFNFGLMYTF